MLKTLAAALLGLAVFAAPAAATEDWASPLYKDNPLVGRIWSRASGGFVERAAVEQAIAGARYVLLGETHSNGDHHRLQGEMITALAGAGRRPAVVFEMVGADYADKLAGYLAGPDATAEGFGAAVDWEKRGWPEWKLYQPIVEAALGAGLPMRAGDVARDTQRTVGKEGLAALGERAAALGLDRPLEQPLADALLDELFQSHCELVPREAMTPMAGVQRLRDAAMADAMIAADGDGAVLITGGEHARLDRAVPWYLRARAGEAAMVSVRFMEVEPAETDPAEYVTRDPAGSATFDYVWFTPKWEEKDHCAELKARFEKKDKK